MGSFRRLRGCTSPVCLRFVFVCSDLVSNPCGDLITVKNFQKSTAVDLDMQGLRTLVSPCLCLRVQHVHLSSCLARLEASASANTEVSLLP